MNSYKLLDQIIQLAKERGWKVMTRHRGSSHLVIRVTRPTGVKSATIPMNKSFEMDRGTYYGILRRLNLKEELRKR